jgi:hypothetical protein
MVDTNTIIGLLTIAIPLFGLLGAAFFVYQIIRSWMPDVTDKDLNDIGNDIDLPAMTNLDNRNMSYNLRLLISNSSEGNSSSEKKIFTTYAKPESLCSDPPDIKDEAFSLLYTPDYNKLTFIVSGKKVDSFKVNIPNNSAYVDIDIVISPNNINTHKLCVFINGELKEENCRDIYAYKSLGITRIYYKNCIPQKDTLGNQLGGVNMKLISFKRKYESVSDTSVWINNIFS